MEEININMSSVTSIREDISIVDLYRPQLPKSFYSYLFDLGVINTDMNILDLETGSGDIACELAKRKCKVIGVDKDIKNIKIAQSIARWDMLNIEFKSCLIDGLEFENNSFDLVIACKCLQSTMSSKALNEVKRVLKPGGIIIVPQISWDRSQPFLKELEGVLGLSSGLNKDHTLTNNFQSCLLGLDGSFEYVEDIKYTIKSWKRLVEFVYEKSDFDSTFSKDHETLIKKYFSDDLFISHNIKVVVFKKSEV